MNTILLLTLVLFIALAVLLVHNWPKIAAAVVTATAYFTKSGAAEPSISDTTTTLVDKFLTDQYTAELAEKVEALSTDLAYDIDIITIKKLESAKSAEIPVAKLLLDTLGHYYIYNKEPNSVSSDALRHNIKLLNKIADARIGPFDAEKVKKVAKLADDILTANSKSEIKVTLTSQRECFRRARLLTLTQGATTSKQSDEITTLRDEISRKNVELRNRSSSADESALRECNAERRQLQEKIYDLRREISSIQSRGITLADTTELLTLRARLDDLRARNTALENRASVDQSATLRNELDNCKRLLDEVLSAQN